MQAAGAAVHVTGMIEQQAQADPAVAAMVE
jgi:hypothetical protein